MPRKGVTQPWKVYYNYASGAKGKLACGDEDTAIFKAEEIARYAELRGSTVYLRVWHKDYPEQARNFDHVED